MAKARKHPSDVGGRSARTQDALVRAAISALRDVGFAGASAREIARRAGCNQALVFYHFGSVDGLLLAALDDISARRMEAYRPLLDGTRDSVAGLVKATRAIFTEDLEAGHVKVLVEMITGAQSVPGLGEQVARRLVPWRDLAESMVENALGASPVVLVMPAKLIAHALVAGFLGLELLADLDGDPEQALALFDRAASIAGLLDHLGLLSQPALIDAFTRTLLNRMEGDSRK